MAVLPAASSVAKCAGLSPGRVTLVPDRTCCMAARVTPAFLPCSWPCPHISALPGRDLCAAPAALRTLGWGRLRCHSGDVTLGVSHGLNHRSLVISV